MNPNLRIALGSLELAHPVLVASGTFGYGDEFAGAVRVSGLSAIVTKTLTEEPRAGNPAPRLAETPAGMLNAVGLQNMGLRAFLDSKLPALRKLPVPKIVSFLAENPEAAARMAAALGAAEGVDAIEINLSCPNVRHGAAGRAGQVCLIAQDAEASAAIVAAARAAIRKPILAKLSPDVTDIVPIAQAVEKAGADALTLCNTYVGMRIDPRTRRSAVGMVTGGVSGPAIRALTLYRVWYTAQHIRIPIVGLGGVASASDALEYLIAGAAAVAVGTTHFADPRAALRIVEGVRRYCRKHSVADVRSLRAAVQPGI